ncbi:hypothetical protein Kpho02_05430 [Kitasatospora phosalacinea]|uniref:Uncharacterized protein n=1 Tax=Kitasatospora phosalacinea TaxID=2065 RepID=A0A9W6Q449_9ACTN|nr:hypothetical protein Kpho02_05430 [Kitasatospora phosalacinea]
MLRAIDTDAANVAPVRLFTYDSSQSTRARNSGLRVEKLALPAEGESRPKSRYCRRVEAGWSCR